MQTANEQPTQRELLDVEIVEAPGDALAYVVSTWGRIVEARLEATPRQGFLAEFARIQGKIIKRSRVLVANHGGRIVGFIVYEPKSDAGNGVLHWISVREKRRNQGVATKLLDAAGLTAPEITFWTSALGHLDLARAPYFPFWLRI